MINTFDKIIKFGLYALVFLLPIFWLPFSFEAYEFNKQFLLVFLALAVSIAWLAKLVLGGKEFTFKKTPLDMFVGGFLLIGLLSAVFSADKLSSLFGFYGRFSDGLITLLALGMLYFTVTNNVTVSAEEKNDGASAVAIKSASLLKALLWSSFIAVLVSYFSVFNIWAKISSLFNLPMPGIMFQRYFNPVAGSMEGMAIFLAIIIVLLTGLILLSKKGIKQFSYWVLLAASTGLMLVIDYKSAWMVLLASLILFLGFILWKRTFKENVNKLLLPIFLTIIAGFCVAGGFTKLVSFNLPKEQTLNQKTSWQVALNSATANIKSGFLGSGTGTFHYDFTKEKPVSFNQDRLWQIRFDRSGSHLSEILATQGFLGLFALLGLIGMFFLAFYFILSGKNLSQLPLLMAFAALTASLFFYYQNIVLAFVFWLVLGLAAASLPKTASSKTFSFKDFPELNLIFSTALIIISLGVAVVFYWGGRFYLADKYFFQSQQNISSEARSNLLEKAVRLNSLQPQYWAILSRSYLGQVKEAAAKTLTSQEQLLLQAKIARAIEAAKTAADLGPGQVAAFETLAMVYRDIGFMPGAKDWATKSFEKAIELEPTNPVLRTELAKFYQGDVAKIKEELAKVKKLKPDYPDALLLESMIYEQEGEVDKAIQTLENVALNYPYDVDILFQLGKLYFNNRKIDDSIAVFQRIVSLSPNHSNALYSLGLAYQQKNQNSKAIEYFEKVLELNPGNQDIKKLIEQLKG